MTEWEYNKEFDVNDYFGFVYLITNILTGKQYIGKKFFFHTTKRPIRKKSLTKITGKGRKPTKETFIKESNWKEYFGSNVILQEDIKIYGHDVFSRKILFLCKTPKQLTYWETKLQFSLGVLEEPDKWYNDSILGKFYVKDLLNG